MDPMDPGWWEKMPERWIAGLLFCVFFLMAYGGKVQKKHLISQSQVARKLLTYCRPLDFQSARLLGFQSMDACPIHQLFSGIFTRKLVV